MMMHAKLYGRVQGVGFRAAAQSIAQSLGLKGFVRNSPDGSVEICVEGEKAALDKLFAALKEEFAIDSSDERTLSRFEVL